MNNDINKIKLYRRVVSVALIFFITITVLFFWNEIADLDIGRKINYEKVSAYFTAIASIGTTLTLFLFFWQIKVMEDANRLPIRPEIFIQWKQFEIYEEDSFDLPIVMIKLLFNDPKIGSYPIPYLNAVNVGNGVAKKIKMKWEYDINEVEQFVNGSYNLEVFKTKKEEVEFDFLKPNEYLNIAPPKKYLACCGSKLNPSLTESWLYPESNKKPALFLHVNYCDISNTYIYHKRFEVLVKAVSNTVMFQFKLLSEV